MNSPGSSPTEPIVLDEDLPTIVIAAPPPAAAGAAEAAAHSRHHAGRHTPPRKAHRAEVKLTPHPSAATVVSRVPAAHDVFDPTSTGTDRTANDDHGSPDPKLPTSLTLIDNDPQPSRAAQIDPAPAPPLKTHPPSGLAAPRSGRASSVESTDSATRYAARARGKVPESPLFCPRKSSQLSSHPPTGATGASTAATQVMDLTADSDDEDDVVSILLRSAKPRPSATPASIGVGASTQRLADLSHPTTLLMDNAGGRSPSLPLELFAASKQLRIEQEQEATSRAQPPSTTSGGGPGAAALPRTAHANAAGSADQPSKKSPREPSKTSGGWVASLPHGAEEKIAEAAEASPTTPKLSTTAAYRRSGSAATMEHVLAASAEKHSSLEDNADDVRAVSASPPLPDMPAPGRSAFPAAPPPPPTAFQRGRSIEAVLRAPLSTGAVAVPPGKEEDDEGYALPASTRPVDIALAGLFPTKFTVKGFRRDAARIVTPSHVLGINEFWSAFTAVTFLGEGSFGFVWKCSTLDGKLVAVKSSPISFDTPEAIDDGYSVLREIAVLQFLNKHKVRNVLPMHAAFFCVGNEAVPPAVWHEIFEKRDVKMEMFSNPRSPADSERESVSGHDDDESDDDASSVSTFVSSAASPFASDSDDDKAARKDNNKKPAPKGKKAAAKKSSQKPAPKGKKSPAPKKAAPKKAAPAAKAGKKKKPAPKRGRPRAETSDDEDDQSSHSSPAKAKGKHPAAKNKDKKKKAAQRSPGKAKGKKAEAAAPVTPPEPPMRLPKFYAISKEQLRTAGATVFMVTQLCDGDLDSIDASQDANIARGVALSVSATLHDIHRLGLVHLDLKPGNILYRKVRVVVPAAPLSATTAAAGGGASTGSLLATSSLLTPNYKPAPPTVAHDSGLHATSAGVVSVSPSSIKPPALTGKPLISSPLHGLPSTYFFGPATHHGRASVSPTASTALDAERAHSPRQALTPHAVVHDGGMITPKGSAHAPAAVLPHANNGRAGSSPPNRPVAAAVEAIAAASAKTIALQFFLSDFGNVQIVGPSYTDTVSGIGTYEYMDHMALSKQLCDRSTDCYSLGMTLYRLLTRKLLHTCRRKHTPGHHKPVCYVASAKQKPPTLRGRLGNVVQSLLNIDKKLRMSAAGCYAALTAPSDSYTEEPIPGSPRSRQPPTMPEPSTATAVAEVGFIGRRGRGIVHAALTGAPTTTAAPNHNVTERPRRHGHSPYFVAH
jgi:serine/threonine protein kinase